MIFLNKFINIPNKKRMVIYTAIFGDYDNLSDPPYSNECDFVCFTDNQKLQSNVYKIVVGPSNYLDPRKSAKIYKIRPDLFLQEYDYSVWIDGSVVIKDKKFYKFAYKIIKKYDMAFLKHPDRNCLYNEADACINLQKDDAQKIIKQTERYKKDNYPTRNGLIAGGVIFRNNKSRKVQEINENWWDEIMQGSIRDQLSFNYVAWKNNFKYFEINKPLWDNEFFIINNHNF